jgi:nitrilase
MSQGEQVHIMSHPSAWLTARQDGATIRAASYCTEAKVFTIVASACLTEKEKDFLTEGEPKLRDLLDATPRSESLIMGPNAELKSEIMCDDEGIVYGEIDLEDCVVPKQFHDYAGDYNRFDIFKLTVDRSTNEPVTFSTPRGYREQISMDLTEDLDDLRPRVAMAAE